MTREALLALAERLQKALARNPDIYRMTVDMEEGYTQLVLVAVADVEALIRALTAAPSAGEPDFMKVAREMVAAATADLVKEQHAHERALRDVEALRAEVLSLRATSAGAGERVYTQAELIEACQLAVERTIQNVREGRIVISPPPPDTLDREALVKLENAIRAAWQAGWFAALGYEAGEHRDCELHVDSALALLRAPTPTGETR